MKKFIFTLLFSLCVIGGLVFYKTQWLSPRVKPADFLPHNTLFYFNYKDLGTRFNKFKNTPLAEAIASIDYLKMSLDVEVPLPTVDKMRQLKEIFTNSNNLLLIDELFSKEFTVAFVSEEGATDLNQYIQKNIILISRPKHSATLLDLITSSFSKKFKITSSLYGKHIISRIEIQANVTVTFASVGSSLLITMSERSLRVVLDRYDNKNENLKDDSLFEKLQKRYLDAHSFCYFSIEKIQEQLNYLFKYDDSIKSNLLEQLEKWNGFTAGAYGAWQKGELNKDVVTFFYDKKRLNKNASRFLDVQPEKDKRIYQVPADVLSYYWTNTFYLQTLWDIYIAETKKEDKELDEIEKVIMSFTGNSVNELIAFFGNRFSLMIKKPSTVDFLPVPNITLVFDLNAIEKARSTLLRILARKKVPHNDQSYRGVNFTYWGEAVQQGVQPVFAFYEKSLYLSSSVGMFKDVIDTIMNKNGLTTNEKFLVGGDSLLLKNNSIGYVQLAPALDVSKELVSWGGTMLAIQNRKAAYKSKIVIDGLIQPLLDGLKMYSSIAIRTYMEEEIITIESKTTMAQK